MPFSRQVGKDAVRRISFNQELMQMIMKHPDAYIITRGQDGTILGDVQELRAIQYDERLNAIIMIFELVTLPPRRLSPEEFAQQYLGSWPVEAAPEPPDSIQLFAEERGTLGDACPMPFIQIYQAYQDFCKEKGEHPQRPKMVAHRLMKLWPQIQMIKVKGGLCLLGFSCKARQTVDAGAHRMFLDDRQGIIEEVGDAMLVDEGEL